MKLGSLQDTADQQSIDHASGLALNEPQRKPSINQLANKLNEIQNTLSPTYLSNFTAPNKNSPNQIAIQENLTTLKKKAMQQDCGTDHPITERRSVIDKINELQITQKLKLKFDLQTSPPLY